MAALMTCLMLAGAVSAFSGLANGSFEEGTYSPNAVGYQTLGTGATSISGWTVAAGSVDWIGSYWAAQHGAMSLDLSGTGPGTVTTSFATTPGWDYSVSFWLSANPDGGPTVKTLTVSATGAAAEPYAYDRAEHPNSRADMRWQRHDYAFRATSALTTLTFASTTTGVWGPALDNVSVTETNPEPEPERGQAAACKDGGWRTMTDSAGAAFRNQGTCVSHFAKAGDVPVGRGGK